jgi:hypothetical protein
MNYYNVFYWLTVSDGVKEVFDTFSNIFTFFTVVGLIVYLIIIGVSINIRSENKDVSENKDYKDSLIWRKLFGRFYFFCQVICIITWLGYVLTPTKKDCLLIVAGGAVGNFITTDSSAKSLPSDVTRFLHLSLNKEIDDLSKEVKSDVRKELGIQTPKENLLDKVKQLSKDELIQYIQNDSTIKISASN